MRTYEEYHDPQDKRRAQKGALRGKPTGKCRGYILVFDQDGKATPEGDSYNALGDLSRHLLEDIPRGPKALSHCTPHVDYLRTTCRRVGFEHIPRSWQIAFVMELFNRIRSDWGEPENASCRRFILRHEARLMISCAL